MFHPLQSDLTALSDNEVEEKLRDLTKKWGAAQRMGSYELLTQLSTFVTIYREEMSKRYMNKYKGQLDNDLDSLINVD